MDATEQEKENFHEANRKRNKKGRFIRGNKQVLNENLTPPDNSSEETLEQVTGLDQTPLKDGNVCWNDGRRIVELGILADALESGCIICGQSLKLKNCISEKRYGLGSILSVGCDTGQCEGVTLIPCGKTHRGEGSRGPEVWDANTKLASGMVHAGLGFAQLQTLFAALNIPSISHKSLKRREREAGKAIEKVAAKSYADAIEKEVSLSEDGKITMSFDGGWQTRGSGRSYSSLSGHASGIGQKTGLVLSLEMRRKYCRVCEAAGKQNQVPREHDCRKNWKGSSKAMEQDMAVSMLKGLKDKGVSVKKLVMDDDSTTIAKVRSEFDAGIEKSSDKNHVKKQLTNKLFELQKQRGHKSLNTKTINHIKKCFSYAISKNEGNSKKLKENLNAITPHLFGDHSLCDISWCKYLQDEKLYKPKNLPYGKYLCGDDLRKDLNNLFSEFANRSDMLCDLGSSQANENFNSIVASKAKKSTFWGGSETINFRVAASGCQKNLGSSYIVDVNESLLLSPGKVTQKETCIRDKKRKTKQCVQLSPTHKRRRVELKQQKSLSTTTQEVKEGPTYATSVSAENNLDPDDTVAIPDPYLIPSKAPLPWPGQYNLVFFDLETTGFGDADIVQLAAFDGDRSFNHHVIPRQPITVQASTVTGYSSEGQKLYKDGHLVDTASDIDTCLMCFKQWLSSAPNVVLVGHNCERFDSLILARSISSSQISFTNVIMGFIDTLPLFKSLFPERKSFSQQSLLKSCNIHYQAHDALEYAKALSSLVHHHCISHQTLLSYSFDFKYAFDKYHHRSVTSANVNTFHSLIEQKIITSSMASKIASSGLSFMHLKVAHKREGYLGILHVLGEDYHGKPRVTKCSRIAKSISSFLSNQGM